MSTYNEQLNSSQHICVQKIVTICKTLLPEEHRDRPYRHPELNHGLSLLETEDAMNAYMAAYGEMHIVKCRAALQNFLYDQLHGYIEIVDWGCGQGIGSLCVLEALSQRKLQRDMSLLIEQVKRVTLIEPSLATLNRATMNIEKVTNGGVSILPLTIIYQAIMTMFYKV